MYKKLSMCEGVTFFYMYILYRSHIIEKKQTFPKIAFPMVVLLSEREPSTFYSEKCLLFHTVYR